MPRLVASKIAARLRARTISLPVTHTQRPTVLDIEAAKARTANWEPAFQLDSFRSANEHRNDDDDQDGDDGMPWMVTYSAFDPGASRPLLFSSVAVSMPALALPSLPVLLKSPAPQGLEVIVKHQPPTAVVAPFKPWPYLLPAWLQPKTGTTFELMQGMRTGFADKAMPKRIGVLQAILYGVPEPEKFSYAKEIVGRGGVIHKVLYGVQDVEQGGKFVPVAEVTVAKGEEGKPTVVVEKIQNLVDGKCGFSMVAK